VRHHFPSNLAEAREPIHDKQESVGIQISDVTGDIEVIVQYTRCPQGIAAVSGHATGAVDEN